MPLGDSAAGETGQHPMFRVTVPVVPLKVLTSLSLVIVALRVWHTLPVPQIFYYIKLHPD